MRVRSLLLLPLLLCFTSEYAEADTITYSFSGAGDLSGTFNLDSSGTWLITPQGENTSAILSSPLNQIAGTYGAYTFSGSGALYIFDQPEFYSNGQEAVGQDSWIFRALVSGPLIQGLAPTYLNLFVYTNPAGLVGTSLTPPPHNVNPYDFQFTMSFANAGGQQQSWTGGPLQSLTSVPEPSTLLLLGIGSAAVASLRRRKH